MLGGAVAVRGIAGDQQAALVGQACFTRGMVKATYGTGAFILLNLGAEPVRSAHGMLTTIAYQRRGQRRYALEGAIFSAGTAVQWLRDGVGLVDDAAETGALAALADPAQRVYLVPGFTGLGAPHWNSRVRASISGITRGTTRKELARAVLEAVGYQTRDLLNAMLADAGISGEIVLRVDGGMTASDWTMQFLADMVGVPVERPACLETTALGASLPRRAGRRRLPGAGGVCPPMANAGGLHARHGGDGAGRPVCWMAGGCGAGAAPGLADRNARNCSIKRVDTGRTLSGRHFPPCCRLTTSSSTPGDGASSTTPASCCRSTPRLGWSGATAWASPRCSS